MSKRYDVVVIGLGAMGSAACYHLAGQGARVLGLEKFDIPHANGSSHGFSRMIRMAYREHPDYVPLVKSAFSLWQQLEAEAGAEIDARHGRFVHGSDRRRLRGRRPELGPEIWAALRTAGSGGLATALSPISRT
jgi:sarcosine oxidase